MMPQSLNSRIDIWRAGDNFGFASPAFRLRGILCDGSANNEATTKRKLRRALIVPDIPMGIGMSTGNWRVKPSEIIRVTKAVQSTGLPVRSIEITDDGTIRVIFSEPGKPGDQSNDTPNEWDGVK